MRLYAASMFSESVFGSGVYPCPHALQLAAGTVYITELQTMKMAGQLCYTWSAKPSLRNKVYRCTISDASNEMNESLSVSGLRVVSEAVETGSETATEYKYCNCFVKVCVAHIHY